MQTFEHTIAAIATAAGNAAIGVIRISGKDAFDIVNKVFKGTNLNKAASHSVHYGYIFDGEKTIDEVMVTVFKAPRSFTTENSVEISCHGSPFILEQILQLLLDKGAKAAQPGEFTLRAFLHGRIDLSQAEAVADLIASDSLASQQLAMKQMRGGISDAIDVLREKLIHFTALIELELDFSEEDVEFADRKELIHLINDIQKQIEPLKSSFKLGNAIKNGVFTTLAGKPNAGKSTLLNALLNEERAIVSDIEGTTRDSIEEVINISGIQFRLIDTAGLRETQDVIESAGVGITHDKIKRSAIIVYLFDVNKMDEHELWDELNKLKLEQQKLLVVANKMDLNPYAKPERYYREHLINENNFITLSALNKMNLEALKTAMLQAVKGEVNDQQTIITNLRHYEALGEASTALQDVLSGIEQQISGELLSLDIKRALQALGTISGKIDMDRDVLGAIFGKFCIGK